MIGRGGMLQRQRFKRKEGVTDKLDKKLEFGKKSFKERRKRMIPRV